LLVTKSLKWISKHNHKYIVVILKPALASFAKSQFWSVLPEPLAR
jgi:hypothetical protein